jgi:hypothetical protein
MTPFLTSWAVGFGLMAVSIAYFACVVWLAGRASDRSEGLGMVVLLLGIALFASGLVAGIVTFADQEDGRPPAEARP